MIKEDTKQQIQKLVEKYQRVLRDGKVKSYNEAQSRNEFIEPLFQSLGWDMRNLKFDNEVTTEENISGGRVDLGFRINGIPKMYLEAKPLKADLDNESYAWQAINYAWNKGVTYAVLSDFESTKVYNSKTQSGNLQDKLVFEIPYTEYISDFSRLWLLSKEAFTSDSLDEYAEKYGKKLKKVTVNEKLYADLKECRDILTRNLWAWHKSLDKETIDEGVQRILDRLIFIRVVEDRGLEPPTLEALVREYEKSNRKKAPFQMLVEKFRELDKTYNSDLFTPHFCEQWDDPEGVIIKVIRKLYDKNTFEYDFKEIPADILGGVYESYLGYIAQNPIKETTPNNTKIQSRQKRKEHGIYYTPKYIVDYIVQNTLGEKLKDISLDDIKKLKVCDPACGSGSFLTKALEVINDKYKSFGNPGNVFTKTEILHENIYGVDLDQQAVELAKLNLLLDTLDSKNKLPNLAKNIKNGNSLISGNEAELKAQFGKGWRDQRPFSWDEEFPEAFQQGGFDVVVGNPPYISYYSKQSQYNSTSNDSLNYFINNYDFVEHKNKLGRYNTLMFFIERSMKLLKKDGYLGFIIDTNIHSNPSEPIRKYLVNNYQLILIVDQLKVFEGVGSGQMIIIIQNSKPNIDHKIRWVQLDNNYKNYSILAGLQIGINEKNGYSFYAPKQKTTETILNKIGHFKTLSEVVGKANIRTSITFTGKKEAFVVSAPEKDIDYPLAEGSEALPKPYAPITTNNFIRYDTELRDRLNFEYQRLAKSMNKRSPMVIGLGDIEAFMAPKLFVRLSDVRITASFSDDLVCADLSLYVLTLPNKKIQNENSNLYFLLALLNSKTITYYMRTKNYIRNLYTGTPQIRLKDLRGIPLAETNKKEKTQLITLAQTMLNLNKQLQELPNNSNQSDKIKAEIAKTDKQIDQEVYKLYSLTEKEIAVIENSLPFKS